MTINNILQIRLTNEHLSKASSLSPSELVAWFGAVQSQDYSGAKWALGQRIKDATDASIEKAFTDGEILRTHVMRPTWHFLHPKDIRWMLRLTAPRVNMLMNYYNKQLELDDELFRKSQVIMQRVLEGKKALTREELVSELKQKGFSGTGQRFGHIMGTAELAGLICSGPRKGKQFTYMLLEERIPQAKVLEKDEALAELTKRYFQSHGPATIKDMVWWSGLTTADVKKGILLQKDLQKEDVDKETYYFYPTTPQPITKKVYLLPNYDEYAIAYKNRDILLYPPYGETTKGAWTYPHLIVYEGKIIGLWKRILKPKSIGIEPKFIEKPSKEVMSEFQKSAEIMEAFLNNPVTIL